MGIGSKLKKQISKPGIKNNLTNAAIGDPLGIADRNTDKRQNKNSTNEGNRLAAANAPESPEAELQRLQLEQIRSEEEWNSLMRPQLLQNMGLEDVFVDSSTGKLVDNEGYELNDVTRERVGTAPLTTTPERSLREISEDRRVSLMSNDERDAYDTQKLLADRSAKAAKGELGVPTYVTDQLDDQRKIQSGLLSQRLGAKGANVSTAGITAKTNQMGSEAAVKSAYSRGEEGTGLGLLGQYNQYIGNQTAQNQNIYGSFNNAGLGVIPMAQAASQPYTYGRQLNDENQLIGETRKNAAFNGLMSGVGTVASMYLNRGSGGGS